MRIVLSPNPYRDRGLKAAQSARNILNHVGIETSICLPFDLDAGSKIELPRHLTYEKMDQVLPGADMLICFGGDGTILHAAKNADAYGVPILGVNMGSVGFMAELEYGELNQLSKLSSGKFSTESRMMLDASVLRGGKRVFHEVALNDAALTKGAVARVVDLKISCEKMLMSEFSGDGVVVSTPTGSTGYSMAAGGPIVEPTAENLIITPICAHAMDAKSFVLSSERVVSIRLGRLTRKTAYLSADGGKAFRLQDGDVVEIRKSDKVTKLVRLSGRTFYEILAKKFGRR
jgi:NAD+ kinase